MTILREVASSSPNSPIFLFLFFVLIVSCIAIFVILYMQNRELKIKQEKNTEVEEQLIEENDNIIVPLETIKESVVSEPIKDDVFTSNNDLEDLQSITKELEMLPRERVINMTPFEMEQEEKAIISYDELVSHAANTKINYVEDNSSYGDVLVRKVDIEKTSQVDAKKNESSSSSYEHEEEFLQILKQLNNLLN